MKVRPGADACSLAGISGLKPLSFTRGMHKMAFKKSGTTEAWPFVSSETPGFYFINI